LPGGLTEFSAQPIPDWPVGQAQRPGSTVLIHTGGNLGYAGGMNAGMRYAIDQGDAAYVWLLNNDTVVEPDALSELLLRVKKDPGIGICGSTLVYFNDRQKVQALGGAAYLPWRARSVALGAFGSVGQIPHDPTETEQHMAYVVGAAMLVSSAFIHRVGLMDESYFLYSEEHDWAHRGRRLGFKLGWSPRSHVFHKHGATIGTSASGGSTLSLFYLYRSKALFAARFFPWLLPISLHMLVWDSAKFLLKGQVEKAWAVLRGIVAASSRGAF
jgi:GT2 family glycosyltransferase